MSFIEAYHVVLVPMDMAIVILGASQYDGRASKVLAARLDEALAIAGEYPGKNVHFYTLGANMPGDRFTEVDFFRSLEVLQRSPSLLPASMHVGRG